MIHTEAIYAMYNQAAVGEWFRNDAGAAHTEYIFISGSYMPYQMKFMNDFLWQETA